MNLGCYEGFLEGLKKEENDDSPLEFGEASSDDLSSEWETDDGEGSNFKISRWKTVRTIFHQLTPFILTYKNSKYPWVQLAGHQGNFKPGEQQGTILKKASEQEREAYEELMKDSLAPFVPTYHGMTKDKEHNVEYIELEDLLGNFVNPCVMDIKIGIRTYLEEELIKAREKPKLRKDMYEKMVQIDPNAPTDEEHSLRGVTKPRYMVWRETISTTSTLGFRIEGVRKSDGFSSKDFKTTKTLTQVKNAFEHFCDGFPTCILGYAQRLKQLKNTLEQSTFFLTHEVIGSSLLFVHDEQKEGIWMIDFAKTRILPSSISTLTHFSPWNVGNHEDGYLIGLTNIINIIDQLSIQNKDTSSNTDIN